MLRCGDVKIMIKRNYSKELEGIIKDNSGKKSALLIHCCCAPCSSYVLEYLSEFFEITFLFYNPNISPESEFKYRESELKRLVSEMSPKSKIDIIVPKYDDREFYSVVKGFEDIPEGGERCFRCYELRLVKAMEYAQKNNFEYFTTTLSISPYKNAEKLNEIGERLAQKCERLKWLPSDFKKKNGYKRSIELSRKYNLYRQDYCGCVFSKAQRDKNGNSGKCQVRKNKSDSLQTM